MKAWKIVRVDEGFRVIALGLPVPRYQGNPLDPPLRSRFQARDIHPLPFKVLTLVAVPVGYWNPIYFPVETHYLMDAHTPFFFEGEGVVTPVKSSVVQLN